MCDNSELSIEVQHFQERFCNSKSKESCEFCGLFGKNSEPHPKFKNTRIGISKDGRTIEIKFGKQGIHGYPIFP